MLWSGCGQLGCVSSSAKLVAARAQSRASDVWQNRWLRFAEAVAGLERGGSLSAGATPYFLRSNPPIIKIVD